jgi:ribosomal protein S18 acetylase RimI-like enzyme
MLQATTVDNKDELVQIHQLSQENLKQNLSPGEQAVEGFVTWLYSMDLLEKMHQLAPSIIVKDGDRVVGYALTTLRESRAFHPDLETLFHNLESVQYKGKPLSSYNFYCMGQICVAKEYRGQGIVNSLYQKHKEIYGGQFDFILTEISTRNPRSMKAHQKIGFQTIYTHMDEMDEWDVVVWDWK